MIPLGVVAYPAAGISPLPSQESPFKRLRPSAKVHNQQERLSDNSAPAVSSTHADQQPPVNKPSKTVRKFLSRFSAVDRSLSKSSTKHRPRYGENLSPDSSSPLVDTDTPSSATTDPSARTNPSATTVHPSPSDFPPPGAYHKESAISTSSHGSSSPHPRH